MTADIRPGDVLFVWNDDIISDAIEWITDGPAHMALFIDENTVAEAQGGRPVGERPLSFYLASAERLEIWRDLTLSETECAEIVRYAKSQYGAPYDYALIPLEFARFELGVDIAWYHENKHRICATFADGCAAHVGRKWSQVPNPAPIDEMRGGALTKIYVWEGDQWLTSKTTASA